MTIKLEISSNFYNALRVVSAKNDVRYYLNGILIDFKHKRWVATDGHRLFSIPMDMNVCSWKDFPKKELPESLIVETTRQKISGDFCEFHIEKRDNKWTVAVCNMRREHSMLWQEIVQPIDGKFPDMDRVIPPWPEEDPEVVVLAAYNPQYVADVAKELGGRTQITRIMPMDKGLSAALVEFGGFSRDELTYVIMPMRW